MNVPPFDPGNHRTDKKIYYWWSWHPMFPVWSKSYWGGETIEEAVEQLKKPLGASMRVYANKLVKQEGNEFTEILDLPSEIDCDKWLANMDAALRNFLATVD